MPLNNKKLDENLVKILLISSANITSDHLLQTGHPTATMKHGERCRLSKSTKNKLNSKPRGGRNGDTKKSSSTAIQARDRDNHESTGRSVSRIAFTD